jgi:urease accessory protein
MLIQQKKGNLATITTNNRCIDWLQLEWYETSKRMLRKQTQAGNDIALKFLDKNPMLTQGDVLYEDDTLIIAVDYYSGRYFTLRSTGDRTSQPVRNGFCLL